MLETIHQGKVGGEEHGESSGERMMFEQCKTNFYSQEALMRTEVTIRKYTCQLCANERVRFKAGIPGNVPFRSL